MILPCLCFKWLGKLVTWLGLPTQNSLFRSKKLRIRRQKPCWKLFRRKQPAWLTDLLSLLFSFMEYFCWIFYVCGLMSERERDRERVVLCQWFIRCWLPKLHNHPWSPFVKVSWHFQLYENQSSEGKMYKKKIQSNRLQSIWCNCSSIWLHTFPFYFYYSPPSILFLGVSNL